MCVVGDDVWSRNLAAYKTAGKKTSRAMERRMIGVIVRDRNQAFWIGEQTRVEDILGDGH